MHRDIIECEQCKGQIDAPKHLSLRNPGLPQGWFAIALGHEDFDYHFCSRGCIILWASSPMRHQDWDKLTKGQRYDIENLQAHSVAHTLAESSLFSLKHPELHVRHSLTFDVTIQDRSEEHETSSCSAR